MRTLGLGFCLLGAVALIMGGTYFGLLRAQLQPLKGTDTFGYIQMARSVAEGRLLEGVTQRPFYPELSQYLKAKYPFSNWAEVVAPLAHHVDSKTERVINQYPVGVGLVLSVLPIQYRVSAYPVLCAGLLVFSVLFAFWIQRRKLEMLDVAFMVMICHFLSVYPFWQIRSNVSSVPITFGLLFSAAFLLKLKPRISFFLLGLASIFRVANLIFIVPFLFLDLLLNRLEVRTVQDRVRRSVPHLSLFGLGYLPNALYVFLLVGNPFRFTYSVGDSAWANLEQSLTNFRYYFIQAKPDFLVVQLLLLGGLLLVCLKNFSKLRIWFFWCVSVVLFNFTFMAFHKVAIFYYPYASALIVLGVLVSLVRENGYLESLRFREAWVTGIYLCFIVSLSFFWSLMNKDKGPKLSPDAWYQEQKNLYQNCFSEFDATWAFQYSGAVEYYTSKASFKYPWGTPAVRDDMMKWLREKGYKQAFYDEPGLPKEKVDFRSDLARLNLKAKVKNCEGLGSVYVIQ